MTNHKATLASLLATFGYGATDNVLLSEGQLVHLTGRELGQRLFKAARRGRLDWLVPYGDSERIVFVPTAGGQMHNDLSQRLAKRRGKSFAR